MAEHNRLGVILVIMLILLLTPDTGPVTRRNETEQAIERVKQELNELRNSTYGVPGNITGFEEVGKVGPDGLVVMMPPKAVRGTVEEMIKTILGEDANFGDSSDGVDEPGRSGNITSQVELTSEIIPEEDEDGSRGLGEPMSLEKPMPGYSKRDQLQLPLGHTELPLYYNASGRIHGNWHRLYDLPPYILTNSTKDVEKNITGRDGKITIRIEEARPGEVQEVQARISFESEGGLDSHDIMMSGVHIVKSGDMVLTTYSKDFSGPFALPHFTLNKSRFEASRAMLIVSLSEAIKRQEESPDGNILWSSRNSFISDTQNCEYITYLQLHPIRSPPALPNTYPLWHPIFWYRYFFDPTPITPSILRLVERELRHPTGIPVPPAPPILLDGVVYSPNCGFVLSTKSATGVKIEQFHSRVKNFALSAAAVVAVQTWLLIRQMNESSTPSTVSRVSFWSIAMMAIVDGYMAGAFILVSVMVESSYLALVTAAFLSFVLVVVFGMRFLITIWGVQRPERRAAAAASTPATAPPTVPSPGLPTPATAATAQTPLIIPQNGNPATTNTPPADDGRQDISTIYSRFYFLLIGGAFLFLHVSTWSPPHRHMFVSICAALACSFWVPQIYRNIMRGCRKALGWEFVLGTSTCRVLPVLYLFCLGSPHENGAGGNIFGFEFKGMEKVGYVVTAWVAFQVVVLWIQEWAGPRVGIPGGWLPRAYDYHPILPVDDLEAAQPFSAATPTSPTTAPSHGGTGSGARPGLRSFDCAICMHPVEVLTVAAGTGGGEGGGGSGLGGLVTRRSYMVTPCRHVFHAVCLEGWMRMRLQCPICRNQLPPL
ncbi:hypothetical protein L211DRAFT_800222 [Terfezia boudieri ATCC MYA-4762]|uniref:RING-type E3 ubiquitin transferase n=1 Tax=Terfezia boudieri ATCC MYA-4762 TaxID=1051890 RepID=A0A3N4M412_9PEZI|nr:hypothetical protein L211DRAFT_800222 [Terfezia boudieri ATCC MYA-4762]